ncbi:hypothetical protein [Mycobacterium paragordonae]|jgi:hypothetical protein|uniref:Uncharacterized protein n=1 Tax=Mycobacterium paragordonae TaxID=1389713 RepID=A0AAJ1VZL0_9MYCO|nr:MULTISPECIES: hypothetical protein [Mycobacterium]MDP7734000.1 hypothetical protein [Mycobacterium paragordonae]PJE25139.1 MAG: hypothetical protein CK431_02290 [Mycobacterium sp.]TDK88068.1 hypothetical protein EI067_27510 [Mycobacterium paragordonae]GFG80261.1 hypothetical protein MPRG_35370 [Mycobacterium paragordonae]
MSTITEKPATTGISPLTGPRRAGGDSHEDLSFRLRALQRWESEGGAVHSVDEISAGGYLG